MDELFREIKKMLDDRMDLEAVSLPEELQHITLPLKLLDLRCYNWRADRVRKIYIMRLKVAVPSLDILGMALYPASTLDIPSFVFDLSCTRKKVFAYVNFVPLFDDPSYRERYLTPMETVYRKYKNLPVQTIRNWMRPYLAPCAVYSFPQIKSLPVLKHCVSDYLALYLDLFAQAEEITDAAYAGHVTDARRIYLNDLATHDASRKMLGRVIGRERADRIFREVLT